MHGDKEFDKIATDILPVQLQTCSVDNHIPEIERSIQTRKHENQLSCHAMTYKCLPRVMVCEIIKQGNVFYNALGT